jgi:hypothetical protein
VKSAFAVLDGDALTIHDPIQVQRGRSRSDVVGAQLAGESVIKCKMMNAKKIGLSIFVLT